MACLIGKCLSKLYSLCCCKLADHNESVGDHDDKGWAHSETTDADNNEVNESQPLLREDSQWTEYYGSQMRRPRTGFSSVFTQNRNENENRNFIVVKHPVSRRFGKIRTNKKERLRVVGFENNNNEDNAGKWKSEEDQMLHAIVEETAASMIDVSGHSDSHYLSRHDATVRMKYYTRRLRKVSPSLLKTSGFLLGNVPESKTFMFHKTNWADGISQEDKDLMDWATEEISLGLKSIRVQSVDPIVVPFPTLVDDNVVSRRAGSY